MEKNNNKTNNRKQKSTSNSDKGKVYSEAFEKYGKLIEEETSKGNKVNFSEIGRKLSTTIVEGTAKYAEINMGSLFNKWTNQNKKRKERSTSPERSLEKRQKTKK